MREASIRTVILFLVLTAFPAAAGLPPARAATERVTVYNFDGSANLVRNRKTYPVELDQGLRDGDLLRIESETYLDLTMWGIAASRLGDEGELLVVDTSASGLLFHLHAGSFLSNVRKLPSGSSFRVETPIVTAISEGGQFYVDYMVDPQKGPRSRVVVKKGLLNLFVKEASITIQMIEGQALEALAGSSIPSQHTASEEERKLADRALSIYIDDSVENPPPPIE
ncbi:MAG TPA: hypothetical protein VL404_00395 [Candidatus Eisenbacteria bacterium]|jgi:hypothetical protein|nr:hypothetical protein [Candidatus Eisenbacteria bacterium]